MIKKIFKFNPIYDKLIIEIKNKLKKVKSKKLKTQKYSYSGETKNNLPNGWGKMVCINPNGTEGEIKIGEFENGKLNGRGYIKFKHDLEYVGLFNQDKHYSGRALWGSRIKKRDRYYFGYEKEFERNKKEGFAIKFETDPRKVSKPPRVIYEGAVNEFNQPKGKGIGYPTETIKCDGNWSRGSLNGECKVQHSDYYYEGIWKYGKLSKLTLEGKWINNKLTILKDKKKIDKEKYIPFNFTYGRIMWILNLKEDW